MRSSLVLVLLLACTTSREIQKPLNAAAVRELNDAMRERDVELAYYQQAGPSVGTASVEAAQVHLAPDKVRFAVEGAPREIQALSLHRLTYLSPGSPRLKGAAQALLFGVPITLAGAGVGLSAKLTCGAHQSCTAETVTPAVVGAALGLLLAPIIGAVIGSHDEVTLIDPR